MVKNLSTKKPVKPPPKKRGRKPKGGKIVKNIDNKNSDRNEIKTNIILHLKHINDNGAPFVEPRFLSLNKIKKNVDLNEININSNNANLAAMNSNNMNSNNMNSNNMNSNNMNSNNMNSNNMNSNNMNPNNINSNNMNSNNVKIKNTNINHNDNSSQLLWDKIRRLKISLHKNDIGDKRSGCFWCTYDFDNPPIYIPKQKLKNNSVEVYGCFCSPECAVAFLKNEPLDTSVLWERYSLLNNIYSEIYNYEKNIQPAPNPFYTLNKYYGNLTIEEYRSLLNKQHYLVVVDKPITKIMPELYEDITDEPNIYTNLLTQKTNKDLRLSRNTRPNIKSLF